MFDDPPIGAHYGYPCRYTPTIMSGPVFRWGGDFEVSASRDGVMVQGPCPALHGHALRSFLALLALAGEAHELLRRVDRCRLTVAEVKHFLAERDGAAA